MTHHFGIILLSGGLDSTTLASMAVQEDIELLALTFDYGQNHMREITSAKAIASKLGITQVVLDVSFYKDLANHSALTNSTTHQLPKGRSKEEIETGIPISYVPLRNTFFLTLAAARLESMALTAIEKRAAQPEEVRATIFIAANAIDYSGYPDCRPDFYRLAAQTLQKGSKLWAQYSIPFRIETPLITMSKADIVRAAFKNNAPIELSWSCYNDGKIPCGECDSCLLRAKGFSEAGKTDPSLSLFKGLT